MGTFEPGRRIQRIWLAAGVAVATAIGLTVAAFAVERVRDEAARETLVRLFYDYMVTDYCGTTTAAVHRGYELARDHAMSALGLDHVTARPLRLEGWIRADREWENRGLGGFRGWCRTEGVDAAVRFTAQWCAAMPEDAGCP